MGYFQNNFASASNVSCKDKGERRSSSVLERFSIFLKRCQLRLQINWHFNPTHPFSPTMAVTIAVPCGGCLAAVDLAYSTLVKVRWFPATPRAVRWLFSSSYTVIAFIWNKVNKQTNYKAIFAVLWSHLQNASFLQGLEENAGLEGFLFLAN